MERLPRRTLVFACVALAVLWRLVLMGRYYGWEESDYGNLAMARGVLESGFRHFDMNHLPMYYALSALVLAVVGDAVIATRAVALAGGALVVGCAVATADRLIGRRGAILLGLWMVFQPELALYSATSLREPAYGGAVMLALWALTQDRLLLSGFCVAVAFLTRMDALVALSPVLALHALGAAPRGKRLAQALTPLVGAVLGWSAYCGVVYDSWAFWSHSVNVNIETGGAAGAARDLGWVMSGLRVSATLLFGVMPAHAGALALIGAILGMASLPWLRHDPRRTLGFAAIGLTGFWLGIAFLAQHEPGHNLYWKWMYPVLPPLLMVGCGALWTAVDRLSRVLGYFGARALLALGVAQAAWAMGVETERQIGLSSTLYRPQLELAQRIEAEAQPGDAMLVDNIPGCYINRRPHALTLHTWMDVETPAGDAAAFVAWVRREKLRWVLWFREDWTRAPAVAPWLADGQEHHLGGVRFRPIGEEPEYGWILYAVEYDAEPE